MSYSYANRQSWTDVIGSWSSWQEFRSQSVWYVNQIGFDDRRSETSPTHPFTHLPTLKSGNPQNGSFEERVEKNPNISGLSLIGSRISARHLLLLVIIFVLLIIIMFGILFKWLSLILIDYLPVSIWMYSTVHCVSLTWFNQVLSWKSILWNTKYVCLWVHPFF